jgi:hypothetical protein
VRNNIVVTLDKIAVEKCGQAIVKARTAGFAV